MTIHVFNPRYGCSGRKYPCMVCGYEYDKGDHYLQRPCPVCGSTDMEAWSIPELVHLAVSNLIHDRRLPRRVTRRLIAEYIGISPHTLKNWEYKKCTLKNFDRFTKGFRRLLNDLGLYEGVEDECGEAVK